MDNESCDVGLQKDDKYGWKLEVKGDCEVVLDDIKKKLGEYGRRYFEDRLISVPKKRDEKSSEKKNKDEN